MTSGVNIEPCFVYRKRPAGSKSIEPIRVMLQSPSPYLVRPALGLPGLIYLTGDNTVKSAAATEFSSYQGNAVGISRVYIQHAVARSYRPSARRRFGLTVSPLNPERIGPLLASCVRNYGGKVRHKPRDCMRFREKTTDLSIYNAAQ